MSNKILQFKWIAVMVILASCNQATDLGIFENNGDIGNVGLKGSVEFENSDSSYTISGSGTNMWFEKDEFHFVWKEMTGDISLSADIEWIGQGVDPHRKACVIIRQTLDTGSVYADVALHGDGLSALQYREEPGGNTHEIKSRINAPRRIGIEKIGDYISMSLSSDNENLDYVGGTLRLAINGPFYIGLGVCAHNNEVIESARFSNVNLEPVDPRPESEQHLESTLEIISINSFDRQIVYHTEDHIEAPNWSPDGKKLIFNSGGLLYKLPVEGGIPEKIETGFAGGMP
jgi:hypothetical protein